jgi:hypothetical protein
MNEIAKAGSPVSVPTSLIDQLQRMTKTVDASIMAAPQVPAPAPRPDPGPGP